MSARRLLCALLTISACLVGWTAPGGAADLTTAGWWWRAQSGTVGLPPPPHVPPDGLAVGNAPDGPSAVAALRFALQPDEVDPVLGLAVAEVFPTGDFGLIACPAAAPWFGAQAGPWEDRPEAACATGAVNGVESPDGASWSFPLSGIYREGLLDVVVLPAEGSDPFEISFEAPTAESLRTTRAPASGGFGPEPGTGETGTGEPFIPPATDFGAADFGRPFSPEDAPGAPGDAGETTSGRSTGTPREFVRIARSPGADADDRPDPRPLAVVILLAGLAAGLSMMREPLPAPRLLGSLTTGRDAHPEGEDVRGLGRFRRPRRGEPPSLH